MVLPLWSSAGVVSEPAHKTASVHHDLNVRLEPGQRLMTVEDSITLPAGRASEIRFLLHEGMEPITPTPGVRIEHETTYDGPAPVDSFKLTLPPGIRTFVLRYRGTIDHPPASAGSETARGFSSTPGTISPEGIFLAGSSHWYAQFSAELITFTLEASLPPGWDAVSQGKRALHSRRREITYVRWESPEPQDNMYLIAAKFTEYTRAAKQPLAMVFLRTPDEGLANKYLDAAVSYLEMYDKLIGPYPYKKFALVENFWETGFGMPSFTLLGSQVIRLPFIINTSYPHEILHNWWGNSVFPDYDKGNWSEGLTAYLADHLIKEQQNAGAEYRVGTLQKYADYVLDGRDFPLTEFRSRHSSSSEAIGYGKSLMFFHMLRLELGDATFTAGLQEFYRSYKFKYSSFDDLRRSFENISGKKPGAFFDQWVTRTGAPEIRVRDAETGRRGDSYAITAVIRQNQPGEAYRLRIPLAITMEGHEQAFQTVVQMNAREHEISLKLPSRPLRIDIDPEFDLFRRLDREEIPPAISQALGAKKMLILLPSSADKKLLGAYRELAKSIGQSGPDEVEIKLDREIKKLPTDRAVTIIGWENRFITDMISSLTGYDVRINENSVRMDQADIPRKGHSVVLTARNPQNRDQAMLWIASDSGEPIPGLGRKLPHYHKYSYLAFEGQEPANIAKGRWPVNDSPMTAFLPVDGKVMKVAMGKLTPRLPLAVFPPVFSKERMMETVTFLSSEKLKGRGLGTPELNAAADYIAKKFQEAGLKPGGDAGSWLQTWEETFTENPPPSPFPDKIIRGQVSKGGDERIPPLTKGGKGGFKSQTVTTLKNVIGVIPGKKPDLTRESVVIGAHYDHLGLGWPEVRDRNKGKVHPGADDNASGVAVLLELARVLAKVPKPDRTIVFVAFTGEEAGKRGSKYYVANEKDYPAGKCIGMLNLDTVGRLGKKKLLVLGAGSAKEWVHIFRGAGFVTGIDIETVSEELDSSDQTSFQDAGVPAVQLFTGPHPDYHRPADTANKIDAGGLVKVAAVVKEAVEYLASREGPMTSTVKPEGSKETTPKKERRVTLGTIPDFSYKGEGVRIEGVITGSPAETSGLKQGDVIIRINSSRVHNLKELSDILKSLSPGDRVSITFLRDGNQVTTEAVLKDK